MQPARCPRGHFCFLPITSMSVIAFDIGFFAQIATDLKLHDWFRLTLDK